MGGNGGGRQQLSGNQNTQEESIKKGWEKKKTQSDQKRIGGGQDKGQYRKRIHQARIGKIGLNDNCKGTNVLFLMLKNLANQ